ncbi:hypothetical protein GP486_000082 [Trichoglossum hirsutum]|uniref:Uncharacterized protein n=1 Tax=Trichoglossum hirsutum TaxID=265104 RepID=A0A9P8LJE6_9PEZI|nr:hypothetical protein GP486_000082 [Trichoglossum hirsutum]
MLPMQRTFLLQVITDLAAQRPRHQQTSEGQQIGPELATAGQSCREVTSIGCLLQLSQFFRPSLRSAILHLRAGE